MIPLQKRKPRGAASALCLSLALCLAFFLASGVPVANAATAPNAPMQQEIAPLADEAGPTGDGGGIRNNSGNVQLRRVVVDGNQAANGGGILHAGGQMYIVESSLSGNTATNSATGAGGGILTNGPLTVENVTISGNQAANGGGISAAGGNALLMYVTLAGNSATNSGGGVNSQSNTLHIENSLLAGNDAPVGPDCAPGLISDGHNLIGWQAGCALTGDLGSNVMGQPPQIDVLTGNGAETYSHPLLAGSPAIGRATCLLAVDQTGAQRPTESGCDIGAFETDARGAGVFMPIIGKK